uniref:Immunoglobulin domain-containing protein n=1 Tax=Paramormyrops kingsleyae TaxID=1676925 RepID=A0A3B3R137_9TELE
MSWQSTNCELLSHHLHDVTAGGDSVRTFGYLTAQSGESLTIPCFYDQKYKDHVKYWCTGQLWSSCTIMTRTDSPKNSSKVSITDSPAQLVFHVIMRNLKTSDTGIYWCAVEIGGIVNCSVCHLHPWSPTSFTLRATVTKKTIRGVSEL